MFVTPQLSRGESGCEAPSRRAPEAVWRSPAQRTLRVAHLDGGGSGLQALQYVVRGEDTSMRDHSTSPRTLPNLEIIDVPPSAEPT
jgi:hypothetical protein